MNQLKGLYICLTLIVVITMLHFNLFGGDYPGIALSLTVILFIIATIFYINASHQIKNDGNKTRKSDAALRYEKKMQMLVLIPALITMLIGNSELHTHIKSAVFAISALCLLYVGYLGIKQYFEMKKENA